MSSTTITRTATSRGIGLAGLVGTVLLFATIIAGSPGEPPLEASSAEAARYLEGLDKAWIPPVEAVSDIAMIIVLWFMVGLALLLRRFEGEVPVRSTMAILSGTLSAAYVLLDSAQEAAIHRAGDLDQAQLAFAYDLTTIGFTNVWLAMGIFAFACGWIVVSSHAMPRWLGWWGLLAGIAMGVAQFVWTYGAAWVAPYAAFWLWLLTTCVLLMRRPSTTWEPSASPSESAAGDRMQSS